MGGSVGWWVEGGREIGTDGRTYVCIRFHIQIYVSLIYYFVFFTKCMVLFMTSLGILAVCISFKC